MNAACPQPLIFGRARTIFERHSLRRPIMRTLIGERIDVFRLDPDHAATALPQGGPSLTEAVQADVPYTEGDQNQGRDNQDFRQLVGAAAHSHRHHNQ